MVKTKVKYPWYQRVWDWFLWEIEYYRWLYLESHSENKTDK